MNIAPQLLPIVAFLNPNGHLASSVRSVQDKY